MCSAAWILLLACSAWATGDSWTPTYETVRRKLETSSSSLSTTGAKYNYDVQLRMTVGLSLGFDTLKADTSLVSSLTSSLESTLADSLSTTVPRLLALSQAATGTISKISRSTSDSQSAVAVDFKLVVPAGATTAQVQGLMQLAASNTSTLFSGSPYLGYLRGQASVSYVPVPVDEGLGVGAAVGIAIAAAAGTVLLIAAGYGLYQWRMFAAIAPKKPKGDWDPTGVAAAPRKGGRRRRGGRDQAGDDTRGQTQVAQEHPQPQPPAVAIESGGAPWGGANKSRGDAGGSMGDGGGVGGVGVKSEAALPPSKEAWM